MLRRNEKVLVIEKNHCEMSEENFDKAKWIFGKINYISKSEENWIKWINWHKACAVPDDQNGGDGDDE